MTDQFNTLDYTEGVLLQTGQTTDRTPAGRTTKDDGGFQRGIPGSKDDNQYNILTTGQYSGNTGVTVNAITDTHTNACVYDKVTGLMWNREIVASLYGTGVQDLFWDDTGGVNEDIFQYIDQANIGNLSGFNDWRIPNIYELFSIYDCENSSSAKPNTVAFPVMPSKHIWTSTTVPSNVAQALRISNSTLQSAPSVKTTTRSSLFLCRLGIDK